MPPCKNDVHVTYTGAERSPRGLGWCAHADPTGKTRRGRDGCSWIVRRAATGYKFWARTRPATAKPYLSLVHVTWCGFCKRFMRPGGAWQTIKRDNPALAVRETDGDKDAAFASSTGVTTYPDVRAMRGNVTIAKLPPSEEARSVRNLTQFIKAHGLV